MTVVDIGVSSGRIGGRVGESMSHGGGHGGELILRFHLRNTCEVMSDIRVQHG